MLSKIGALNLETERNAMRPRRILQIWASNVSSEKKLAASKNNALAYSIFGLCVKVACSLNKHCVLDEHSEWPVSIRSDHRSNDRIDLF